MKKIKKTFLGPILCLSVRRFPSQLLLHLLRRRVFNPSQDELSFNLNGNVVHFTFREFCMITGLRGGRVGNVNHGGLPDSTILRKHYPGKTQICRKELEEVVMQHKFEDDDFSLKLAKTYLVQSLLLARQNTTNLDTWPLKLVEDEEEFEKYPWGQLSYNLTLEYVKKLTTTTSNFLGLSGFPQALILWAYEILPKLSYKSRYATRLYNKWPRLVNWDSNRQPDWKEYESDIFTPPIEIITMYPSPEELKEPYLKAFAKTFVGKKKIKTVDVEQMETMEQTGEPTMVGTKVDVSLFLEGQKIQQLQNSTMIGLLHDILKELRYRSDNSDMHDEEYEDTHDFYFEPDENVYGNVRESEERNVVEENDNENENDREEADLGREKESDVGDMLNETIEAIRVDLGEDKENEDGNTNDNYDQNVPVVEDDNVHNATVLDGSSSEKGNNSNTPELFFYDENPLAIIPRPEIMPIASKNPEIIVEEQFEEPEKRQKKWKRLRKAIPVDPPLKIKEELEKGGRPKRTRKQGRATKEPFTDEFGSNEKKETKDKDGAKGNAEKKRATRKKREGQEQIAEGQEAEEGTLHESMNFTPPTFHLLTQPSPSKKK